MKMFVYRIFPIKNGGLVGKNSIFAAVWYTVYDYTAN